MSSISKSDIDKNFGKILRDFRVKNKLTHLLPDTFLKSKKILKSRV